MNISRHILVVLAAFLVEPSHAHPAPTPIPLHQIGTATEHPFSGLSVGATENGALLTCAFQKLEGEVTREGLWLTSTLTHTVNDRFRVTAASLARAGREPVRLPPQGTVDVTGKLARFLRPGLIEEYSVSLDGVRQDFVIERRPEGRGELRVELAVTGARAERFGSGARFVLDGSRRRITYDRLRVTDLTGRELSARIEAPKDCELTMTGFEFDLAVVVNDGDAVYPVRIDPTFSDNNWTSMGGFPEVSGEVLATVVDGSGNLYLGGRFTVAGDVRANHIAKWNGTHWSALGSGMNGDVSALVVSGDDLYAGGSFTTAGGVTANRIAKWNGTIWSALGAGMNSNVLALAASGGGVYAGGHFTAAGGSAANYIARWNGTGWSALGSGMNGYVKALAVSGGDVYAGGGFTTAGGLTVNRIAKWNGSSWTALGSGVNNGVDSLAVSGSNVYAGGGFTMAGGSAANHVARWNGTNWSAIGSGISRWVYALAVMGSDLYAGVSPIESGGGYVFKWNGTNWSTGGLSLDDDAYANALAVSGNELYVGGAFSSAGSITAFEIAKWNGTNWSALGSGINNSVKALAVVGSDLYAGGFFTTAGTGAANHVAKWNGTNWSAVGSGVSGYVYSMAVSGSNLYAGGDLQAAGGIPANRIAKWNGVGWSALGPGVNMGVWALAASGSDVYVGGYSSLAAYPNRCLSKWNGTSWSDLSSGMSGIGGNLPLVYALAVSGSDLYVAGNFAVNTAGGSVNYIAKWNGTGWSGLGSGLDDSVNALAVLGSDVVAAGNFTTAGGIPANRIAKWNGSSWAALGSGMNNFVTALAVSGNDLYAGGRFTDAGGYAANSVARWNGTNWSGLGSGIEGYVAALAATETELFAGGGFSSAGGKVSVNAARARLGGILFPGPEIAVEQPADVNLVAGVSRVDFGSPVRGSSSQRTFTLHSCGDEDLTGLGLAIDGANAGEFAITASPAASLPPGGSTTFTITFTPTVAGTRAATLHIASNDPDESPFDLALTGQGPEPAIVVEQPAGNPLVDGVSSVDFGVAMFGSSHRRTLTITNAGTDDLTGLGLSVDGPQAGEFVVTAGPAASLPPGGGTTFTVTFTPAAGGVRTAALHLVSNDADENPFDIHFTGSSRTPGTIAQQAYVKASGVGSYNQFDEFGWSVAISGDTMVIGAPYEDSSSTGVNGLPNESASDSGAAYVFVRREGEWTQEAYLKPAAVGTSQADDFFGWSVAISGDSVVVGAPWENSSTTGVNSTPNENAEHAGAAYVFVRSGTNWTQQAYLKPASVGTTQVTDNFGTAVAISGDTVVVGASQEDSTTTGVNSAPNDAPGDLAPNNFDSGAAYVFVRSGTNWAQQAYLKPAAVGTSQARDEFGSAVAVSGDTLIVGAPHESSTTTGVNSTPNDVYECGAAYVFIRSGANWTQQAYLKPAAVGTLQQNDRFGCSVAISGDTVVVGAYAEDSNTTGVNSTPNEEAQDSGAAYVFVRTGTSWMQQAFLKPASVGTTQTGDFFGVAVAISEDTIVVAAQGEDSNTTGVNSTPDDAGSYAGAAYIFVRSGANWLQQAYLKPAAIGTSQYADQFGRSVAVSGDTVVAGAYGEASSTTGVNSTPDENGQYSGAVYVFTGLVPAPEIGIEQPAGISLVNGVSSVSFDSGLVGSSSQRSFTITNSGTAPLTGLGLTIDGANAGEFVVTAGPAASVPPGASTPFTITFTPAAPGVRTATLHIVNNDADENPFDLTLTSRRPQTVVQQAYVKPAAVGATQEGDFFGSAVAIAADTIIVGAPWEDSSSTGVNSTADELADNSGAAYILVRNAGLWAQQAYVKPTAIGSTQDGDAFGNAVAVSGDTLVVGAPGEDGSATVVNGTPDENAPDSGAAYVFVRSGTNWIQQAYLKAPQTANSFGHSVAVSGDTLVVGAAGAAFIFVRSGTNWTPQVCPQPAAASSYFGHAVAVSGDTVVVGDPYDGDNEEDPSGAAHIFVRSGTNWIPQAYLKWPEGGTFGICVAASGNTVVVGTDPGNTGAAFVFARIGTNWMQQAVLRPAGPSSDDFFGSAVAVSGDAIVVGAYGETSTSTGVNSTPDGNASYAGAAYVFVRSGTNWTQRAYLKPAAVGASQADDEFGGSVAISGNTIVVGARGESSSTTGVNNLPDDSEAYSGAAYVFTMYPEPVISLITSVSPFQFLFDGNGIPFFQVEASTNLMHWFPVGTATNIGGNLFQFSDPAAPSLPYQFYRLKLP